MDNVKPPLISFKVCPFDRRAVIMLREYGVDFDFNIARPRLVAYRDALLSRPSVADSVVPEFTEWNIEYFRGKGGHVTGRLPATTRTIP
jgi:hypothetical protein